MSDEIELQEVIIMDRDPVTAVASRVLVQTGVPDGLNIFHGCSRMELARRALKRALKSLEDVEDLR